MVETTQMIKFKLKLLFLKVFLKIAFKSDRYSPSKIVWDIVEKGVCDSVWKKVCGTVCGKRCVGQCVEKGVWKCMN